MNAQNRKYIVVCLLLFAVIIAMIYQVNADISTSTAPKIADNNADIPSSKIADTGMRLGNLEFYTSLEQAAQLASDNNKMLFVYLRSETCGWCKKFESESFRDDNITSLLSKNFILLTIDIYKQKDIATEMGVRGTPNSIFYDASGKEILRIPGYVDKVTFLQDIQKLTDGTPLHLSLIHI